MKKIEYEKRQVNVVKGSRPYFSVEKSIEKVPTLSKRGKVDGGKYTKK